MRATLLSIFLVALATLATLFTLAPSIAFASGTTWTQQPASGQKYWDGIASSADGTKLAAVARLDTSGSNPDYIYTSTDGGVTWTQRTDPGQQQWAFITSSADGTKLAADSIALFLDAPLEMAPSGPPPMGAQRGRSKPSLASATGTASPPPPTAPSSLLLRRAILTSTPTISTPPHSLQRSPLLQLHRSPRQV